MKISPLKACKIVELVDLTFMNIVMREKSINPTDLKDEREICKAT